MKNNAVKIFYTFFICALWLPAFAQMQKGSWAAGTEFSFLNSRNDQSVTNYAFSNESQTGFNLSLLGGRFINDKWYLYSMTGLDKNRVHRIYEAQTGQSVDIQKSTSAINTYSLGMGARRYIPATKNIGFFLQGQVKAGRTDIRSENYWIEHDSLIQDNTTKYHFNSLTVNVVPGVYLNLGRRWQLTLNMGNLYFIQTWYPAINNSGERRNATFGMDVNIFDFRLGALYFLGKPQE